MTEHLKQLLDDEAHGLRVPPPPTDAVLGRGRGLRRRHRVVAGACGVAAAIVVSGGVFALTAGSSDHSAPDAAGAAGSGSAVFSYGNEVFYDGPGTSATIGDTAVKSLFYTSAGVLVRHGDNPFSDGGGPQRFSLVSPEGDVQRLGLVTEGKVHASDPAQPYVVFGEAVDGELQVVVYDVTTDAEAARVTVGPTRETWFPVSIDGDTVYVEDRSQDEVYAVDWQAGSSEPADVADPLDIAGGRAAVDAKGPATVVDVATGEVLVTADGPGYFDLSPDGRYAQLVNELGESSAFEVYDVGTGGAVSFEGAPYEWGWTSDGDLFRVRDDRVETCDAATGDCVSEPYVQPAIPEPPPITETMSQPVCPEEDAFSCYSDRDFFDNCYENPQDCEWSETRSITPMTVELKLGGRIYES